MNVSDNDYTGEFIVTISKIIFEHKDLGLGFEINPCKFWYLYITNYDSDETTEESKFSFINTALYWDLLENKNVLLGPFVSINYLFINNSTGINMSEFIFSAGLCFSFLFSYKINADFRSYYPQLINFELGYRNITGKSTIYFSLNVDVLMALIGIGGLSYNTNGQYDVFPPKAY